MPSSVRGCDPYMCPGSVGWSFPVNPGVYLELARSVADQRGVTRDKDLVLCCCKIARVANALIDQGEHLHLFETRRHIFDGDLFTWLNNRHQHVAPHLWSMSSLHQLEVTELLVDLATIRAERKYGISNDGLALIVAYCLEVIQALSGA